MFWLNISFQEAKENKNRLEDKTNLILALEAKIRELSKPDNTLQDMLKNVRDVAAAELQKFKDDAAETYHDNVRNLPTVKKKFVLGRWPENLHAKCVFVCVCVCVCLLLW